MKIFIYKIYKQTKWLQAFIRIHVTERIAMLNIFTPMPFLKASYTSSIHKPSVLVQPHLSNASCLWQPECGHLHSLPEPSLSLVSYLKTFYHLVKTWPSISLKHSYPMGFFFFLKKIHTLVTGNNILYKHFRAFGSVVVLDTDQTAVNIYTETTANFSA